MASKYSVEFDLNTKGYKDGIKDAENANADFVSSLGNIGKSLPNLKKELNAARKEAMSLALAYSKLTDEEKKSGFGQQMSKALEEAKQKTAELIDLTGDLNTELKNMASDTAAWDAMKEGIGVARDAMTALVTVTNDLFGADNQLAQVIQKIAQIQSIANAVISIGNALQKQSALMNGIRRIQELALTKAIKAETAATHGATVAQTIFNAVAKANPYVLLATVAVSAALAIGGFMLATNKQTEAEKRAQEQAEEATKAIEEYKKECIATGNAVEQKLFSKLMILREEWKRLSTVAEQTKFIKDNKSAFDELGVSISNVTDAERFFINQAEAFERSILLRAQAAIILKKIQDQLAAGKFNEDGTYSLGYATAQQLVKEYAELQKEIADIMSQFKTGGGNGLSTEAEAAKGSIADLSRQISDLETKAKKGILPDELKDPEAFKRKIKELTDKKDILEIQFGFKTDKAQTQLQKLKAEVEKAQNDYTIAVEANDESARLAAQEAYYTAQDELSKYKASITIEPKLNEQDIAKQQAEINRIVQSALRAEIKTDFDTSEIDMNLVPESMKEQVQATLDAYNRIKDARNELLDIMNDTESSDSAIALAQQGLEQLDGQWQQLTRDVLAYYDANKQIKKQQKSMQQLSETVQGVGNAVQAASNLFSALGDVSEDNDMKAMGIIAQAVATVALSFAQALTTAKTWVDWLAFGITGMATMLSMVSQIKNLNSGSYAGGGIIGGSSYYGDRLTANVNSGEMILNRQQQKNLFDAIYQDKLDNGGISFISLESSKVRGSDIYLSLKNYTKTTGKKLQ